MSHFFVITLITVQHHSINPHLSPRTFCLEARQFLVLIRGRGFTSATTSSGDFCDAIRKLPNLLKKSGSAELLRDAHYIVIMAGHWRGILMSRGQGDRGKVTSYLGPHNHNNDHLPRTWVQQYPGQPHKSSVTENKPKNQRHKSLACQKNQTNSTSKASPLLLFVVFVRWWSGFLSRENEKFNVNWTK